MGITDKLLGKKHHVGRCTYKVSPSNDIKPEIREVKDRKGKVTGLGITPICRCGEKLGEFILDDPTAEIVESMILQRRQNEESGKRFPIEVGRIKGIDAYCSECGREIHVGVNFTLDKPAQDGFFERHEKASETFLYGDALKLEVSVDGGYFRETRSPRELQDLVNPLCNCAQVLHPKNLRQTTENMIEKITQFFENDGTEINPIETKDIVKCPFCLLEVTVKSKITPTLPTNKDSVSEIVRRFQAWQNRKLT